MKTKIINQKKNPFLEREEFLMQITSDSTPTKTQIIEELGKDKELTIIKKIKQSFGKKESIAEIFVYEDKTAKDKNEVITRKKRRKIDEERKKEKEEKKKRKAEEKEKTESENKEETEEKKE